jgi:hypothetical protein
MRKIILTSFLILFVYDMMAQRFELSWVSPPFKRHYSCSVEGTFENGQVRQVIAGNKTDWLINNQEIDGMLVTGGIFTPQKKIICSSTANYQLTDFCIFTGADDIDYAAGTGIYYPNGATGFGYPFIGVYERGTSSLVYFGYYNMKYSPESADPQSCVGLRIKYNEATASLYVCGTMVDRLFVDLNFQDLIGKSKGFILKVRPGNWNSPVVKIFTPDYIVDTPLFSAITDMEFYPDGSKFAFTGIHTKQQFNGLYGPVVGEMASDLSLQWCKTYDIKGTRVSGVDVEYNSTASRILVMMNNQDDYFSVMETNFSGTLTQNPVNYTFSYNNQVGNTNSHIMHYSATDGLIITGNSYFSSIMTGGREQWLYRYIIPTPSNLLSGNNNFNSYSEQLLPTLGRQEEVTGYWTPENSVYQNGNLSIVGCYNDNNTMYGFTFVNVNGMTTEQGCIETGDVSVNSGVYYQNLDVSPALITTTNTSIAVPTTSDLSTTLSQFCPNAHGKSVQAFGLNEAAIDEQELFKYRSSDENGIYADFYVSEAKNIAVSVSDMNGRQVYTGKLNLAEGANSQYLRFRTQCGVYMVKIISSEGIQSHKVMIINR